MIESTITALKNIKLPEPGVYRDVAAEVYHSWPLCSAHAMGTLAGSSPLHLQYQRANPSPRTPALLIGEALHTLVLEHQLYAERHPKARQCEAFLKTKKKDDVPPRCRNTAIFYCGEVYCCGVHAEGESTPLPPALSEDEHETVLAIADSVTDHPAAARLLAQRGDRELTVVWDREVKLPDGRPYQLRCKMRADIIRPDWGIAADLKTTEDASADGFARSTAKFGYHRQAAHYLAGLATRQAADAGLEEINNFVFIAVEKHPPYATAVYRLDDASIEMGRAELEPLYVQHAICEASGKWPGYDSSFQDLSLPAWKKRQA